MKAGHRVTVITGAPNFPQGKVHPGYANSIRQREEMEGIDVVRVWTYITAGEEMGLDNVLYIDSVPGEDVPRY